MSPVYSPQNLPTHRLPPPHPQFRFPDMVGGEPGLGLRRNRAGEARVAHRRQLRRNAIALVRRGEQGIRATG